MIHHKGDSTSYFESTFDSNVIQVNDSTRWCFEMSFIDTIVQTYLAEAKSGFTQKVMADETTYLMELKSDINSVSINTVYDFDSSHKIGSDITEYLTMQKFGNFYTQEGETSLDSIESVLNQHMNGDYYNYSIEFKPVYYLNTKPTMSDTVSIVVKIIFEDSTSVQARTKDVIIR